LWHTDPDGWDTAREETAAISRLIGLYQCLACVIATAIGPMPQFHIGYECADKGNRR